LPTIYDRCSLLRTDSILSQTLLKLNQRTACRFDPAFVGCLDSHPNCLHSFLLLKTIRDHRVAVL
jgi:hypothetical protein